MGTVDQAREAKAQRIGDVLLNECDGWDDADVALLAEIDDATRCQVAFVAGVRAPSEKTWRMAVDYTLRVRRGARVMTSRIREYLQETHSQVSR